MTGSITIPGEVPPELFEKIVQVERMRDDTEEFRCNRILMFANALNCAAPVGLLIRAMKRFTTVVGNQYATHVVYEGKFMLFKPDTTLMTLYLPRRTRRQGTACSK